MLDEFINYLSGQLGQPYLWGGQHTKLTPENYKEVIARREAKEEDRRRVEAYCEKKFLDGCSELFGYDCSGLGCYWLYNLKHLYKCDVNANTMMGRCIDLDTPKPPEKGWWVFRLSGTRAVHIGYMVDDEYLIEAKGRDFGVCKTRFKAKDWDCWGIPKVFEDEIRNPEPQPVPPEPEPEPTPEPQPEPKRYVEVLGRSVRVRAKDGIFSKTLFIAHKGKRFELIDVAPSGWYHIMTSYPDAYITNKTKYTKLIDT